jgi:CheY-like chemotaxis protein
MHNILLVEDNLNNIRLVEQMLEDISEDTKTDIHLVKALNGREALEKAEAYKYSLILMDISLPDMDGVTTMKNMRKFSSLQDTPIIAATAHAMTYDEELFRGVFDDYIAKPIDEGLFTEVITKWLGEN